MGATCPTCGQPIPLATTGDHIVRALDFTSPARNGPMPVQLYLGRDGCWYLTGPSSRDGWIKGPINKRQVEALAQAAKIAPDLFDKDRTVLAYALPKFARRETVR